jgi:hypothetical protein
MSQLVQFSKGLAYGFTYGVTTGAVAGTLHNLVQPANPDLAIALFALTYFFGGMFFKPIENIVLK